jgi:tRNA pseudouridine55 synthase
MTASGQPDESPRLDGFLIIDKPVGPSSMKAVARVRWCAGRTKTGHAGTLDPLASGVLVVGLGKATKMLQSAMATDKVYETTIDLSGTTPTFDAEVEAQPVTIDTPPDLTAVEAAMHHFRGTIQQAPPAFSAMKVNGQRAYKLARKGEIVDLPEREAHVHSLDLLDYQWPNLTLRIHCRKGFYVRALARDMGKALGTGGWCRSIRRTAVGPFTIQDATALHDLPEPLGQDDLLSIDAVQAMLDQAPS